jgi:hypothetical protein
MESDIGLMNWDGMQKKIGDLSKDTYDMKLDIRKILDRLRKAGGGGV